MGCGPGAQAREVDCDLTEGPCVLLEQLGGDHLVSGSYRRSWSRRRSRFWFPCYTVEAGGREGREAAASTDGFGNIVTTHEPQPCVVTPLCLLPQHSRAPSYLSAYSREVSMAALAGFGPSSRGPRPCWPRCGWSRSRTISSPLGELVRNLEPQALPQTHWIPLLWLTRVM